MFNKKFVITTLSVLITSISINTVTFAAEKIGWQSTNDKWYFIETDGSIATGWKIIEGKWYYLEDDGMMVTGWKLINDKWYYLQTDGSMATGWKLINDKWYYLQTDGSMVTGWALINGKWYYLLDDGSMATGWALINGRWFYLQIDGSMATGYLKIDNNSYFFNDDGSLSDSAYTLKVEATAYTGYSTTSTGQKPIWGTIAVDPKVIPYGTRVYIPQFDQVFVANNTGGAIKGNKIDIFMNTTQDCRNWGRRTIDIEILN